MASPQTTQWTPERIEEVRSLTDKGLSDREIGARLGVTKGAICGIRTRQKIRSNAPANGSLSKRQWSDGEVKKIQQMILEGYSQASIGLHFGVSGALIGKLSRDRNLAANASGARRSKAKARFIHPGLPQDVSWGKYAERFAEGFEGQTASKSIQDIALYGECRFPIDQPDGSVRFCGDRAEEGSAYCPDHAARCYSPRRRAA